jgi:hypothetical protein
MPRLRLVDDGYPFKKIMQGSKWIGRVYKNAQGTYTGQIGKNASRHEATAATPAEAFSEVAARYFGQPNAAALHARNQEVARRNRAARGERRSFVDDFLRRLDLNMHRPVRAEQQAQSEESGEDDFVPPVGRRH